MILRKANIAPTDITGIFEVGSRDCLDAISLSKSFNQKVYAFEANPEAIELCRKNIGGLANVVLIPKAVTEVDGSVEFLPFDTEKYNNIGASSLFEIDWTTNRDKGSPDYDRGVVQKRIKVPSLRLDTFCKEIQLIPELICLDCQGAELIVLKSLGATLSKVKYIISECSTVSTYKGGCSFDELYGYLKTFGFNCEFSRMSNQISSQISEFDAFFKNTTPDTVSI